MLCVKFKKVRVIIFNFFPLENWLGSLNIHVVFYCRSIDITHFVLRGAAGLLVEVGSTGSTCTPGVLFVLVAAVIVRP